MEGGITIDKDYIDRELLLKDISETVIFTVRGGAELPTAEMRGANKVKDRILSAPAVDVVEVVRCKECVFAKDPEFYESSGRTAYSCCLEEQDGIITPRWDNDYCSYGEWRE